VIAGGADAQSILDSAEYYDPLADSFFPIAGQDPVPTVYGAGAVLDGKLYVLEELTQLKVFQIRQGYWTFNQKHGQAGQIYL